MWGKKYNKISEGIKIGNQLLYNKTKAFSGPLQVNTLKTSKRLKIAAFKLILNKILVILFNLIISSLRAYFPPI